MRKRIYEIIEIAREDDRWSRIYDIFMLFVISLSILPLAVKEQTTLMITLDKITVTIFIIDYLLRLLTADLKLKKGRMSFVRYPFTFMAIVDLLSILPSLTVLNKGLKLFRIFRLFEALRVFRVLKFFRYSKNIKMILNVFRRQKQLLIAVCVLAGGYILVSALVIFNVEPETFDSIFEAVYWATITMTTVGYGDIVAVSTAGKVITMISTLFGVAIVALPAGIIYAGIMQEIDERKESESEDLKDPEEKQ